MSLHSSSGENVTIADKLRSEFDRYHHAASDVEVAALAFALQVQFDEVTDVAVEAAVVGFLVANNRSVRDMPL